MTYIIDTVYYVYYRYNTVLLHIVCAYAHSISSTLLHMHSVAPVALHRYRDGWRNPVAPPGPGTYYRYNTLYVLYIPVYVYVYIYSVCSVAVETLSCPTWARYILHIQYSVFLYMYIYTGICTVYVSMYIYSVCNVAVATLSCPTWARHGGLWPPGASKQHYRTLYIMYIIPYMYIIYGTH